ncbi:hypothetical protein TSUD_160940 [Trifolium subterraneum]|uniref:Uncharacterized protein n=1 Tax=Trifolium subterraneum TaxID=3900 RepID=A0A2Z6NE69_TRISU|nr:hypothetical protein TSUD_160940 [Trifolium subterraneum]
MDAIVPELTYGQSSGGMEVQVRGMGLRTWVSPWSCARTFTSFADVAGRRKADGMISSGPEEYNTLRSLPSKMEKIQMRFNEHFVSPSTANTE